LSDDLDRAGRNAQKTLQGIETSFTALIASSLFRRNAQKTLQGIETISYRSSWPCTVPGRNAQKTLQGIETIMGKVLQIQPAG